MNFQTLWTQFIHLRNLQEFVSRWSHRSSLTSFSAFICAICGTPYIAEFFFCVHPRNLRDTFYFQTLWTFHFVQTQGPASLRLLQHGYFMNFLLYELSTLWTHFQQFSNSAFLQLTFAHSQNPPNKISSHILNTIVNSKLSTIKKSNSLWNNPVIY